MRVIDLLNKIADGVEVPEKIRINNIIFEYRGDDYLSKNGNHEWWLFSNGYVEEFERLDSFLKTEVEIIEEKKIPEKIEYTFNLGFIDIDDKDLVIKEVNKTINDLYKKYNEIIDYLEEENGN